MTTPSDDPPAAAYIPELMAEYAQAGDEESVRELAALVADPAKLAAALGAADPPGKD